jgi:hypothetical protein
MRAWSPFLSHYTLSGTVPAKQNFRSTYSFKLAFSSVLILHSDSFAGFTQKAYFHPLSSESRFTCCMEFSVSPKTFLTGLSLMADAAPFLIAPLVKA